MKKLVLKPRDGANVSSFLIIDDDQLEKVMEGMQSPIGFWCRHKGSKDPEFLGRGEIVRITSAGRDAPEPNDVNMRIAAPKITDEERAANIEKFSKMRRKFEKDRIKKREAEQLAKQADRDARSAKEAKARKKAQDDLHNFIEKQRKEGKIKPLESENE